MNEIKRFYTADPHYYHKRIIEYCERPFADVFEMNEALIKRHNETVGPDDEIIFVGDVGFFRHPDMLRTLLAKLNGTKILVLGNHDDLHPFKYVELGFLSVHTSLWLEGKDTVIVHDPAVASINSHLKFITGHVHQLFKKVGNAVNCGVDVWDFRPVEESVLLALFDETAGRR
jgi:calcineurin-like phosphoesterase family protein